jgi:predicted NBD/HSP70 family sugar kinase
VASGSPATPGTPRLLRALNDRSALDLLLAHGPLTRTRLGELTGLSKPTASQLLSRLEAAGLVRTAGTRTGTPGPSAQLYEIDAGAGLAAGVDVSPYRAAAEIVDLTGRTLGSATVELPRRAADRRPAADVRTALAAAAAAAGVDAHRLDALTIGAQGAYDPLTDRLVYGGHMPGWSHPGLLASLQAEFGPAVSVENDVNLAAVGEQTIGLPYPTDSFALLWMGDGLGLAVHLGGVLHRGSTGGAGEIGYMPVPDPHPAGAGGRRSVALQDLVGGPAVLRLARAHGITARRPELAVARALADPAPGAAAFLHELAARVATGLATIVAVLDPDLVVLSGPVGRAGGPLRELVRAELHRISPLRPRISVSAVPGNPVLAGAVALAVADCRERVFTAHDED